MGKLDTFENNPFQGLTIGDDEAVIIRNMFGEILFAFKANKEMYFTTEEMIIVDDIPMHINEFSTYDDKAIVEIHVNNLKSVLEVNTEFNEYTELSY